MEKFYHPSGLRFLKNKNIPFNNLKKIIKLYNYRYNKSPTGMMRLYNNLGVTKSKRERFLMCCCPQSKS